MFSNIISDTRELRTGLGTGFMLLFALILICSKFSTSEIVVTKSLNVIYKLIGSGGILIISATIAYLLGVSYLYWLETKVNEIHKWSINKNRINKKKSWFENYCMGIVHPISNKSIKRLNIRTEKFYNETINKDGETTLDDFKNFVIDDLLWMDGKLTDKKVNNEFIRINTEAYFRIGIGVLIPIDIFAILLELRFSKLDLTVIIIGSILATYYLVIQGFYLHKKSISMLAHHIADGEFITPSMENLKLKM